MRHFRIYTLLAVIFAVAVQLATAQGEKPRVHAALSRDSVMIGDQFELVIDVESDVMQRVVFPDFNLADSATLELVDSRAVDTVSKDGRKLRLRKRYILTTFDEGRYNMGRPAVLYADKNVVDTLYAEGDSLRLLVATFQIDSTSRPIYDIKAQRNLPFQFAEISGYMKWGGIIALIILALLFIAWKVLAYYGKNFGNIFKPAPPVPPHVTAIEALEALHNKKLWQNNQHKLYYSSLTDILKSYISGRYDVAVLEMTSNQTLKAIQKLDISRKSKDDLRALLKDADLAKFAKAMPEAEQNEDYYNMVYYFVEETKIQEVTEGEGEAVLDTKQPSSAKENIKESGGDK
ncbi:MAG: hypothetical protein SNH01_07220 [Rikenellaceae bacterium]